MRRTIMATMGVLVLLAAGAANADLKVPLTVTDRAGYARVQEPVTSGVPLPRGLMEDTKTLTLLDPDGKPVPAQFTVATRWWPERSIRWVHVDFRADCPRQGHAVYTLTDRGANPAPKAPVKAVIDGDTATVSTGVIRFTVNRAKFNLIDQCSLDPAGNGDYSRPLLAGRSNIMLSHCGTGYPTFKNFSPANDPKVTLAVEENGPMRAVLKLTGQHISTDDQPGDNRLLDFVCRITAYAGSGIVRVVYSLECKQGTSISVAQPLDRWWISVPVSLDKGRTTWALGRPKGKAWHPGTPKDEIPPWHPDLEDRNKPGATVTKYYQPGLAPVIVASKSSKEIVYWGDFFRKRAPYTATGKLDKIGNVTVGWVDVSDGAKGVMAGIRDFWQTYPRAIKAEGTSLILMPKASIASRPDLLTRPLNSRCHFYPGISKTSEMMLYFHGPRDVADLTRTYVGLQKPLFAAAEPGWYCEKTRAFGRLASSDKSLYDAATQTMVAGYDAALRESLRRVTVDRNWEYGDYDSYGFFNFGDTMDYIKPGRRGDPADYHVTWDNGYYDYPRALLLQWARTGEWGFFEHGVQAQGHVMDVDMMCWAPNPRMIGANRYCDGTMHIRQTRGIYVSPTFNHFKSQSHYMRWYLTADRRSLDQGLLSTGFALMNNGMSWGEPRSIGHGITSVIAGYEATGDVKYLKRARAFTHQIAGQVAKGTRSRKGRYWQAGIGIEGLRHYYELTGDEEVGKAAETLCDHVMEIGDYAASTLQGLAFVGARRSKPAYLARARKQIDAMGPIGRTWGIGQSFGNSHRNSPFTFWYFTKDLAKDDPIKKIDWPE